MIYRRFTVVSIFFPFRRTQIIYRIIYSLTSETAKKQIKSLRLKTTEFEIWIQKFICIYLVIKDHYSETQYWYTFKSDIYRKERTNQEGYIEVMKSANFGPTMLLPQMPATIGVRELAGHFQDALHYPKVDDFKIECDEFDLKSICDDFEGMQIKRMKIEGRLDITYYQEFMKVFCQQVDELVLFGDPFTSSHYKIEDVLIQNSKITLQMTSFSKNFDTLLINNARRILVFAQTSLATIDIFLKHWVHGSNPRMEYFAIELMESDLNEEECYALILKGLACKYAPIDQIKQFDDTLEGGMNITGVNDTVALIHLDTLASKLVLQMFVLN